MTDQEMLWEYGGDILRSPTMAREREIPQHGSTTCFDHSVAVALCSIRLARKWGWDVDWRSLVRGALLHDYFLYNWREHNDDHKLHGFYHARRAMENAERDFGLNPIEANIIHRHMFPLNPTPPKYKESVVVTCADKICATQAPARLVFGIASSIAASRIQISPWSHRCVTHGSIVSKSPQRRCACIQFKIASSAACTCAHLLASQQWSYHIIFAVK